MDSANNNNIIYSKEIKNLQKRINFLKNQIKNNNEFIRKNCNQGMDQRHRKLLIRRTTIYL